MKLKLTSLLIALVVGAFVVAGCGSDSSSSSSSSSDTGAAASSDTGAASSSESTDTTAANSGGGGEDLKLSADPSGQLKFDKTSLDAKAGKVTITMDNPAPVPHAIAVEGNGVDKDGETVQKGGTSTVSVDLKPGSYTFYCPVPGHRQAGMQGKLTVK